MRINNHATPEFFEATLAWARRWPSVVAVGVSFLALLIAGNLIRFGGNWGGTAHGLHARPVGRRPIVPFAERH